jgi:hypothetical protein
VEEQSTQTPGFFTGFYIKYSQRIFCYAFPFLCYNRTFWRFWRLKEFFNLLHEGLLCPNCNRSFGNHPQNKIRHKSVSMKRLVAPISMATRESNSGKDPRFQFGAPQSYVRSRFFFCWNPVLFAICLYIYIYIYIYIYTISKFVWRLGVMARGMAVISALP